MARGQPRATFGTIKARNLYSFITLMKIFYRLLLGAAVAAVSLSASAEAPANYYSSLTGKKEGELKTAIYNVVRNFTRVSSYSDLPRYFQTTDVYPNSRQWWDMYSDIPLYAPNFSGLNREHSFPKSWWGGSTSVGAYVDLNHLYPSEARANQAKSNYPLGTVDPANITFQNGICKVGYPVRGQGGNAQKVFEPDDRYKGDFARTYFYMVTAYQDLSWRYTYMVSQNLYPTLNQWSIDLLMEWHRADPVSQKEVDRNEAVWGFQNNRNPFIDMPELAEYLWGTKKGEPFKPGGVVVPPTGDPQLTAPTTGMELQFGQVALGQSKTAELFVHGQDLRHAIEVLLYTQDAKMFSVYTDAIPAAQASSDEGYWLKITYTPTETGTHQSRVLLSGDFEGSRGVALRGECLTPPTLSACTALPASDIMSDRYTANWTAPANEVIDYYVVTRTKYINGVPTDEELVAEDTSLEIVGFDQSDTEAYGVQSVRLGVRSPMSNIVFVSHSGINGVEVEEPFNAIGFEGFVRIICTAPHNGCTIYDIAGRAVAEVGYVEHNTEIALPTGVYFITTATHRTPVKVIVR